MRDDKEVVIAAITQNPDAILYASENLKMDEEIRIYLRRTDNVRV